MKTFENCSFWREKKEVTWTCNEKKYLLKDAIEGMEGSERNRGRKKMLREYKNWKRT